MKAMPFLLMTTLALVPALGHGAQAAQAKMYCLSLKLQQATDLNGLYALDFTTLDAGINGELAPDFVFLHSGYFNSAFVVLTDEALAQHYHGGIGLDLPAVDDADGNGFPDFFEVSQAVNAFTTGTYNITG